ncbi:male sterility protein 2-related [Holotrichia oblita]|uniref:Male sterility protein 2-related n=1 Tax=Holotrichia oblita TaxID=644536 RepID=A0ACB9SI86_HOLOL|nr:male sterility protein 2-related [Holotrichia oblita]
MAEINFDQEELDSSQIREYFDDATILITGATGFLGKLILEKLLRSFTNLRRIYLIVRPKKGQSIRQRLETVLEDQLFNRVRSATPNFAEKLFCIRGECARNDLGLNADDKKLLTQEVSCVFHCAALMDFEEKLRQSTYVNVRATKDLIRLAKSMKNLKSFIHVSSVFAHSSKDSVNEEFYKSSINCQQLLTIVDAFDDVIATSQEPIPGWIENLYGPTGLLVAVNLGLARSTLANPKYTIDVVPADYVVNLAIAASWNIANLQALNENQELVARRRNIEAEIPIYNAVSSPENPITWEKYISLSRKYSSKIPSTLLVSHSSNKINSNRFLHYLYVILLHYIPAIFIDLTMFCWGKPPLLLRTYRKIDEFTETFKHFTLTQWYFKNTNTQALWKKLNATDRQLFEFDMSCLNWQTYYYVYMRGIRIYVLKDPLETVITGAAKYFKLKIMHYICIAVVCFFAEMTLTTEELVNMVFILGECQKCPLLASRIYASRYPEYERKPRPRFQQTGINKPVTNEANQLTVLLAVEENPQESTSGIERVSGIECTSIKRI